MALPKCGHCGAELTAVESIEVASTFEGTVIRTLGVPRGVVLEAHCCPSCHVILGVTDSHTALVDEQH